MHKGFELSMLSIFSPLLDEHCFFLFFRVSVWLRFWGSAE